VRGSLSQPVGQTLLRFPRGPELALGGQEVRQSKQRFCSISKKLFQEFKRSRGEKGTIKAGGGWASPSAQDSAPNPLGCGDQPGPPSVLSPDSKRPIDGSGIGGSRCSSPCWRRSCRSKAREGFNAQPGGLGRSICPMAWSSRWRVRQLVEEKWTFQQPLVLVRPEVETTTGPWRSQAIPISPSAPERPAAQLRPDCWWLAPPVTHLQVRGIAHPQRPIDRTLSARRGAAA